MSEKMVLRRSEPVLENLFDHMLVSCPSVIEYVEILFFHLSNSVLLRAAEALRPRSAVFCTCSS